jgi:hypothetical protein
MKEALFCLLQGVFPALLFSQETQAPSSAAPAQTLPDAYVGIAVGMMFVIGAMMLTWRFRRWLHKRALRKTSMWK